jgi:hypothetical protein
VPGGWEFTVQTEGVTVKFSARLNAVVRVGAGRLAAPVPPGAAAGGHSGREHQQQQQQHAGGGVVWVEALTFVRERAPPALAAAVTERLRELQRELGARNNAVGRAGVSKGCDFMSMLED